MLSALGPGLTSSLLGSCVIRSVLRMRRQTQKSLCLSQFRPLRPAVCRKPGLVYGGGGAFIPPGWEAEGQRAQEAAICSRYS